MLLGAALLLAACGRSGAPNVVILVLDTMRADRLAVGGATRTVAPFLEGLAARGTSFRHAVAQTSWTAGSVASLITSRYLLQHGLTGFDKKLGDDEVTLAEVLQQAGYRTLAVSANTLLRPAIGVAQGFDQFEILGNSRTDRPKHLRLPARAHEVNTSTLAWVDAQPKDARLFLYLQYMEPHLPYDPPAEYLRALRGDLPTPPADDINAIATIADVAPPPPETMQAILDFYDASIMAMDAEIARLFDELMARGVLENALVIVTADHGEELREHGVMGHGKSLYDTVLRVPLIIVPPRGAAPIIRDEVVQLVDVAPTVLDWVGVERPSTFEGYSLRPWTSAGWRAWLAGAPPPARPALSELEPLLAVHGKSLHHRALLDPERRKVIRTTTGDPLWFDQRVDPGEHDATAFAPSERNALAGELDALLDRLRSHTSAAEAVDIDTETRERLKALGYTR